MSLCVLLRDQAIVIGQALLHGKWLECVHRNTSSLNSLTNYYSTSSSKPDPNINQSVFYDDNAFYKPGYVRTNKQKQ
jgi:hypothetical protein